MQEIFDELELVMSTRIMKHVEIAKKLSHGCMMA
jgi:hypothetical protein